MKRASHRLHVPFLVFLIRLLAVVMIGTGIGMGVALFVFMVLAL